MENENLPAVRPTTDIEGKDEEALQAFIAKDTPGFASVTKEDAKKMFDLYLHGKTYRQISGIMRTPKVLVMYISRKTQWFQQRQEYMIELEEKNIPRIIEARLMSQDFYLQFIQAIQKKNLARVNRYLVTGDEDHFAKINLKEIELHMKAMERLQKSIETPKASGPLVGINMPDGATLTRTGENTIEVTPKDKAMDGMLKKLADLQRDKDKKDNADD